MRSAGRTRSRIVRALRVLLPLAALGVLSMLFLLARNPSPDTSIPYVELDGADLTQRTGMTAPRFAGVSSDGARVTLSAARADPSGERASAEDLALEWASPDLTATLRAGSGNVEGDTIRLDGGARMTTSTGWTLTAPSFAADTAAGRITAPADVRATAPFGTIEAGSLSLSRARDGNHVLDLNGGVRLIYRP